MGLLVKPTHNLITMKKLLTIFLLLVTCELGYSQYTYFNNVYQGNTSGTLQMQISEENESYISLGLDDFGIGRRSYSLSGEILTFNSTGFIWNDTGSGYNMRDNFLRLNDGFISAYNGDLEACSIYPTGYVGYALYNYDLDTIWTIAQSEWSNCGYLSIGLRGFVQVDDQTIGMVSSMGYLNGYPPPVDSFAIRITTFDVTNGNILTDHFRTHPYSAFPMRQIRYINGYYYILSDVVFHQTNPLDYQSLLIKLNDHAEIIGELQFGNPSGGWEKVPQMEINNDGNIVLVHEHCTDFQYFAISDWQQMSQMYITVIEPSSFTVLSDVPYPMPGLDDWIRGVQNTVVKQDAQNNYLVVSGVGKLFGQQQDLTCVVTKLDSYGALIWQNIYQSPDYDDLNWAPAAAAMFDLIQTSDGGYLASGVSYSECCQNHWLLKIDNCGYEQPSGCPAVVGIDDNNASPQLQLWPNPFYNQLKAVLPQNASRIFITDMTGRTVLDEKVYFPNQQFDVSQLSKGVYLFNVVCDDGKTLADKIVKQ